MAARSDIGLIGALIAAIVVLFVVSLAVGPVLLSPATVREEASAPQVELADEVLPRLPRSSRGWPR